MSTKQRKADLELRAKTRAKELETGRALSAWLSNPLIAWVYEFRIPGVKTYFGVRFSAKPESTLASEPGSILKPIAGFRAGKVVQSFATDVPLEIPAPVVKVAPVVDDRPSRGWYHEQMIGRGIRSKSPNE